MELQPKPPTAKGSSDWFDGDVYVNVLHSGDGARTGLALVRFTPGAHTAWHSHASGQTLHCVDGLGLVVSADTVIVLRPGDTVWTPPGELHWHGASPDQMMCHYALTGTVDAGADEPATTWGEKVSGADYAAASDLAARTIASPEA